ncbi:MAG: LemA family protein [Candidatus Liptonbacteria bacterium]|nr:LemA family protein [Parcubacteria group bacterium]MBI4087559.1 LemA family protein [Candidatus Liptonbacteria bacterium]
MNLLNIVVVVVAVLVIWLVAAYNGLVRLRNRAKEAWSDIDVQLKRRYDLIPNLVESVKGYMAHEQGVLENVIKARSAAMGAHSVQEHGQAENMLSGALKSLFALAEAYPNLRASENFAKLQDELSDTENKLQAARRFYNTNVMTLNTQVEQFPTNVVANTFGFKKEEFFQLENPKEAGLPQVKF